MAYIGKSPTGTGVRSRFYYTQTSGGGTSISGTDDNSKTLTFTDGEYIDVYLNGVLLVAGTDYNTNTANTISGLAALANGDVVEVVVYDIFTVADTVSASQGGTFNASVTIADDLTVDTSTLHVDSANNRVGVGTTSPALPLEVNGSTNVAVFRSDASNSIIQLANSTGTGGDNGTLIGSVGDDLYFRAGDAERMRINSSGDVKINNTRTTSVPFHVVGGTGSGTSYDTAVFAGGQNSTNGSGARIYISGCENDPLTRGTIIEGIMVNNSNAHQLRFSTNAGASAPVERLRIHHTGQLTASTTEYFASLQNSNSSTERSMHYTGQYLSLASYNEVALILNRMGNDGSLIHFRGQGTVEGTVSVSGSTVSYNGGHLSRWSQLTDGTRDNAIVKGTVMTNLDQMAVWSHDEVLWTADDELPDGVSVGDVNTAAYTEENEQLNCMAVSSVEGDANVAGVFVNWDYDDDGFNDMNVAMTGDMVIRIAQGTTVARGDLLMSAGDGTAKPQGDDIVRSKTIAKVTSTTVSHTYDDGSYLVPCVLMAC